MRNDTAAGNTQSILDRLDHYLATWLLPALLASVSIVVCVAILIGAAADDTRREFGEGGFITHLSALILMGPSALRFAIFLQHRGNASLTDFACHTTFGSSPQAHSSS